MFEPLGLKVNLVGREDLSFGYGKEMLVVKEALELFGCSVVNSDVKSKPLFYLKHKQASFDINIFIDQPSIFWASAAKKNWLIPNPEFFLEEWLELLKNIDLVLCKNFLAEQIFKKYSVKTFYTGFTTPDISQPIKKEKKFLHSRGRSPFKNTDLVFNTWCINDHLPPLTLIESPQSLRQIPEGKGICYIPAYISDEELKFHKNKHLFHLCPSVSEGFGHYINEALSASCIVITTDAPPMNELVLKDHGILVPFDAESPMRLGRCYYVSDKALLEGIEKAFSINDEEIIAMGQKARLYYEESRKFFLSAFYSLLKMTKKELY